MTTYQIKCVIEIAKTNSLNKAAENLYVSQPNLSRILKSLEDELGFKIFSRSSSGAFLTLQGQEFLVHANSIMKELDKIELIGDPEKENKEFSISVPKGSYISKTFRRFIKKVKEYSGDILSIDYKETSTIGAINNILLNNFNLGIIRYPNEYHALFEIFLQDSGLISREICSFNYVAVFSEESPLARKEKLYKKDFENLLEITHGDSILPGLVGDNKTVDLTLSKRVIRCYDSMGQLQFLTEIPDSFMIIFPLDEWTLKKYHLVQRVVEDAIVPAKDYIISKKDYVGSKLDKIFADELENNAKDVRVYHSHYNQ